MATIKQIKDTNGNIHDILTMVGWGTCPTAAATAAKVATIEDTSWTLRVGSIVGIKYTNTNTAGSTTTPVTLNVNNTGAKNIVYAGSAYTSNSSSICGYAGRTIYYMYDGTNWVWFNIDNNTTYTFATGDSNGQIKVTPSGGSATNISVKGLGSLAYKSSLSASDVGASASGHTHDERYFTETEADVRYVKLNSGSSFQTIYSSGDTPIRVKNTTDGGSTYIGFFNKTGTVNDAFLGSIGVTPSKQINFYNGASNTVLHSGNYTDYAASLTGNNTFTGTNIFNNNEIEFASGKIKITDSGDVALSSEGYIIPGKESLGFKGNLNGTATKAYALTLTSDVGSTTQPVYFKADGKPVACTYTLGKSVPSDAKFTDTTYTALKNPNAIKFKNALGAVVTYDGSSAADLSGGVYSATTATNANNVKINVSNTNDGLPILFTTWGTGAAANKAVYMDSTKSLLYNPNQNTVTCAGGFFDTSDERLKDIVNPITVDLDKLSKLRKVYFNWKDKPDSNLQLGMIAQDVQELYPELVSESNGQLSLSYEKLSVIALEAIDVLHNENNELKSRIERLESLVNQLAEKVND
jgi:hypothetical protein